MHARGLIAGECDVALAGASSPIVPEDAGYSYEPGMPFSPDGHCRPFDAKAQGTVFGSGVGVVVLKLLQQALEDGDDVYAVIKGTAVNNDGGHKQGMTAPSVEGQAAVIRAALRVAQVDPRTISYIEAHGTGTELGDAVEVTALTRAISGGSAGACLLGSVKGNVGHLGWAAGIAGFIKTVLALRHGKIPPTLHFSSPNRNIDFAKTPFAVNTELRDWTATGARRAGVSAFGLGGVNAHIVLEEAQAAGTRATLGREPRHHLIGLSARNQQALDAVKGNLAAYLKSNPSTPIGDVAFTLNVGRRRDEVRDCVTAADCEELVRALETPPGARRAGRNARPKIAALFSGQGAEYHGMARRLYETEPVFRNSLDDMAAASTRLLGATIPDILYRSESAGDGIADIRIAQPAVFAIEIALWNLWRSWGVVFDAVCGHSLGEYAAACAAGVMDVNDGFFLVASRGRLFSSLPETGAMVSVFADENAVCREIEGRQDVCVAAANGPLSTIIAGTERSVEAVCEALARKRVRFRKLPMKRAGHSFFVDPVLDEFEGLVSQVALHPARLTLISNVSGSAAGDEVRTAVYWRRHMREPVRFEQGIRTLETIGVDTYVEMGPANVSAGMAGSVLGSESRLLLSSLRPGRDDRLQMLESFGALFRSGADVDLSRQDDGASRRRLHLPTYPFQRQKYWIEAPSRLQPDGLREMPSPDGGQAWQDILYESTWSDGEQAQPSASRVPPTERKWLVLTDAGGLGDTLANALSAHGDVCFVARLGGRHEEDGERVFSLDAPDPAQMEDLVARLPAEISGIVYMWTLDVPEIDPAHRIPSRDVEGTIWRSCAGLLHLINALNARNGRLPRLWLVTRGSQLAVGGDRLVSMAQSAAWGMMRVAAMEHPELTCVAIDLDREANSDASLILREIAGDGSQNEVAYRGGKRLIQRIGRRTAVPERQRVVSNEGTYLVTGGSRGLGFAAASRLLECGAGEVVLMSRNPPSKEIADEIASLRHKGHRVGVRLADLSDPDACAETIDGIEASGRPLKGIVHAAAILDDAPLSRQDRNKFSSSLAAKALGALNLHHATLVRGIELDFFVLFSSATSMLGNAGQANYAAASSFADALIANRRLMGLPGLSLNWGPWSDVGYLARHRDVAERLIRSGMGALRRRRGPGRIRRPSPRAQCPAWNPAERLETLLERYQLSGKKLFLRIAHGCRELIRRGATEPGAGHRRQRGSRAARETCRSHRAIGVRAAGKPRRPGRAYRSRAASRQGGTRFPGRGAAEELAAARHGLPASGNVLLRPSDDIGNGGLLRANRLHRRVERGDRGGGRG